MKTSTTELREILISYKNKPDSNHWLRRFFRCYIDGSYTNYNDYKRNTEYLKQWRNSQKKLRMFVISKFTQFLETEFEISANTIRREIKNTFSLEELENLNKELIKDSLDLIQE